MFLLYIHFDNVCMENGLEEVNAMKPIRRDLQLTKEVK